MNLTLLFEIDGKEYGLEIDAVQEIIEEVTLFPIPERRPFLPGVINAHGEIRPVIDLPALMGTQETARDGRLVVLTPEFRGLALTVGRVGHIRLLDLERPAAGDEAADDRFCRKAVEGTDGGTVRLLDMNSVYTSLEQTF